jgi:type II secretory ATPase GspE/PulE/Tfp pilus assembly ATPase PilB-like protein/ActR/RegA family two-component response regulator
MEAVKRVAKELNLLVIEFDKRSETAASALLTKEPFKQISSEIWEKGVAIPIKANTEDVTICFANPLDMELIRRLEFVLQRRVKATIGFEKQIRQALKAKGEYEGDLDFDELLHAKEPLKLKHDPEPSKFLESNITQDDISTPTVIKLVNKIFAASVQQGASDIHITPESSKLIVRIRVDGILRDFADVPSELVNPIIARIKVLCGMDITEKRLPQDARLRLKTNSGQRDLRISTVPTAYAEDIVIRVLSSELGNISLDTLGMPEDIKKRFCGLLRTSSKVHLVTGPTGSGKTSTLYAGLLYLRDGTTRIVTIEDPIEYRMQGVSQIQVNSKIDMTFATALRSVLRQDPDVVLVGEIRDAETAITATQVSQTGHLVLSTLHTNNAIAAITRLKDLGIQPFLISSSLGSVIAQRLVRKICKHCKTEATALDKERAARLGISESKVVGSKGCDECGDSGFKGRLGIFSFLEITPEISRAIHESASEDEIERLARIHGFVSLEEAGLKLVEQGVTTFDELERVVGLLERPPGGAIQEAKAEVVDAKQLKLKEPGIIQKRKVLLVDDDADLRSLYSHILEMQMFDVTQAIDGKACLDTVYQQTPDVIVLDLMMPRMSGKEVLERLRADPQTRNIPVLMLTASASEDSELELIKGGADDFVSKASRTEVIVARINRLLNRAADRG